MLGGGTQRHAFPHYQSEETKILNISLPRMGIDPISIQHDWPVGLAFFVKFDYQNIQYIIKVS